MTIYISGKITGLPENEVKQKFESAYQKLKGTGIIISPIHLKHNEAKTWEGYMKTCIKQLMECDTIYMLKDWKDSKGAITEYELAKLLKIKVLYEVE